MKKLILICVLPWLVLLAYCGPHIPPCSATVIPNVPCEGAP